MNSEWIKKSVFLLLLIAFGFTLENLIVKLFDQSKEVQLSGLDKYIRDVYRCTEPRSKSKLFYLAAYLRIYKEKNGSYPPSGLITNNVVKSLIPFYTGQNDPFLDFWGNPYLIGKFPVIVVSEEGTVVGDMHTYYYRVDTKINKSHARDFLGTIKNLQMEENNEKTNP